MNAGPQLVQFDRAGRRMDWVRFHPAYHDMMSLGISHSCSVIAWEGKSGGHFTNAAMAYLASQTERGTCCPMTMTFAAMPILATDPALSDIWRLRHKYGNHTNTSAEIEYHGALVTRGDP